VAYLKPAGDWQLLDVTMVTGAAVVACDAERRTVATGDGKIFGYDRLLLATGTRPRRIGTFEPTVRRVHYLRNIEDPCICASRSIVRTAFVIIAAASSGLEAPAPRPSTAAMSPWSEPAADCWPAFPGLVSDVVEARHRNMASASSSASRSRQRLWTAVRLTTEPS